MTEPRPDFLAIGSLHCADFDEGTITIKVQGDMPPVARGRYAIVHFDKFSSTVRMARLWANAQGMPSEGPRREPAKDEKGD